jgi:hypothetical protein
MMFLLLAGAFLVVGCGGNGKTGVPGGGGQPGTGTRTISGRVTNAANPTQGIRNAAVKLFPSKLKLVEDRSRQTPIAQTTTDQNGNFALTANDGEYLLRVELPDGTYQAVEIGLTVTGNINLNVRLVPREIIIARVEIVVPPGDGPGGSYLVGKSYRFRARAFDPNGQEITTPLVPNWQVVGGIGTIADDGTFTARSPGTGKIIAIFTVDKRFEATITVSQAPGTNQKPNKPVLIEPQNQAVVTGRPTFRFSASDPDGNRLRFKIEILKNGAPFRTYDQTQDTAGWSKPDYGSGEQAQFIPPTPLQAGDYQWLVYAYDGRDWSEGSEIRSFTVNNPPTNLTMIAPDDNASVDKRPQFKITATDPDGDRLRFKIELLQGGSVVKTYDQTTSTVGWDQTDYPSGATATFTVPESLGLGTYQWRFYAYDGRTWSGPSPTRTFSIAPTAIVVGSSQSAPLRDLLVSNGFRVTLQDTVPTDIGDADVLVIDDTLSLSTSDAPKVEQLLNAGKSVVLIGHAPAMLATGNRLPTNANKVDISSISSWFGGVTQMWAYSDYAYAWDTGLFPLPTGMQSGDLIYWPTSADSYRMASCTTPPVSPGKIAAADGRPESSIQIQQIFAFAYPSPTTGSRLYWQWAHTGNNPSYASKVNALFIAGVKWAARVPTGKIPHWVRSRRR